MINSFVLLMLSKTLLYWYHSTRFLPFSCKLTHHHLHDSGNNSGETADGEETVDIVWLNSQKASDKVFYQKLQCKVLHKVKLNGTELYHHALWIS